MAHKNTVKILIIFLFIVCLNLCLVIGVVQAQGGCPPGAKCLDTLKGIPGAYEPQGEGGADTITKIFSNFLAVMTLVAGVIFLVQFSLGALSWITSSGDREKVQKAQNKMIHAVIGLIAVVAAYSIAFIVGEVLGVKILNPAEYITNFWTL